MAEKQPNVLFLFCDDLNNAICNMGRVPFAMMRNIERIMLRGTSFTNAHCSSPICAPSRSSLYTGLYSHTTGHYTNWDDMDSLTHRSASSASVVVEKEKQRILGDTMTVQCRENAADVTVDSVDHRRVAVAFGACIGRGYHLLIGLEPVHRSMRCVEAKEEEERTIVVSIDELFRLMTEKIRQIPRRCKLVILSVTQSKKLCALPVS